MKRNLLILLSVLGLIFGVGTGFATSALATSGGQWCNTPNGSKCVNAWSGGPFVKLYTGQGGGSNSDFDAYGPVSGHIVLMFTGTGTWADGHHCIGDAYNDPSHADSSLDNCGGALGGSSGWGVLFDSVTAGCPPGYLAFRNVHWGGYLGPASNNVNGSSFYLNKTSPWCVQEWPKDR